MSPEVQKAENNRISEWMKTKGIVYKCALCAGGEFDAKAPHALLDMGKGTQDVSVRPQPGMSGQTGNIRLTGLNYIPLVCRTCSNTLLIDKEAAGL